MLSYWDIYKNYYANKQEEIGAAIDLQMTNVQNNVNAINVNAASLPQTGVDAEAIPLNATTYIDLIRDTGMPQDEMQVRIITDAGPITLATIGRRENTVPNTVRFWYDAARWGNRQAISREYQTPTAQVRGIQVNTFPLSNIDKMREQILGAAGSPVAFDVFSQDEAHYNYLSSDPEIKLKSSQQSLGINTYYRDWETDRKSTRLNSSHRSLSRMPSSA